MTVTVYVTVYVGMCVRVCVYARVYADTCECVRVCVCVCVCVCMCVCLGVQTHMGLRFSVCHRAREGLGSKSACADKSKENVEGVYSSESICVHGHGRKRSCSLCIYKHI